MNKPLISVCISVYNGEKHLHTILSSFLCQTLKECELVIVDNHSTDGTYQMLMDYQSRYPDKIRVLKTPKHYDYPAKGRYQAIMNARAEYIYVCDADDEMACCALEKLYEAATSCDGESADVVFGGADCVRVQCNGDLMKTPYRRYENRQMTLSEACLSGPEFWTKLIKKDLYIQCGEIPEIVFDDVSYIPGLISYANKVCSIKDVVYYYYRSDSGLSAGGTGDSRMAIESIRAEEYMMTHSNPKYKLEMEKNTIIRIISNLSMRWAYSDYFIQELKSHYSDFVENELITTNEEFVNKIEWYLNTMDNAIPGIVYLNGFTHNYTNEEISAIHDIILTHDSKIVILNSQNCDIEGNQYIKEMFDSGNLREVAKYFGLKNICETGGYFIDDCIKLNCCLNFCSCFKAFIGMESDEAYNDHIFGACADNEVFKRIFETYKSQNLFVRKYSLADRIKLILTSEYNVSYYLKADKCIWAIPSIVILTENYLTTSVLGNNICEVDYSMLDFDDTVTIRRSTINSIITKKSGKRSSVSRHSPEYYEETLNNIYNSNTWKIVQRLRRMGDGPLGPFMKKILRIYLNMRSKNKGKK